MTKVVRCGWVGVREGGQGVESGCDGLERSSRAGVDVTDSICGVPCHRIAQSSESEVSESRSVDRWWEDF